MRDQEIRVSGNQRSGNPIRDSKGADNIILEKAKVSKRADEKL